MQMEYKVTGTGRPLVLVPGGLTGWVSWEPHEKILSLNHKVIRVQLISVQYGNENLDLPEDYTIKTESNALGKTLDSLSIIDPVDIAGWSFGGYTSLMYSLDHPERIRTLTLIEPPALWVLGDEAYDDPLIKAERKFFRTLKGDITDDMLAGFLVHAGFIKEETSAKDLPQWNMWLPFKRSLRNSLAVADHKDDLTRLKNFNKPVLLVKGTGSGFWLHRVIDVLEENLPNSKVIELPEGHGPHLVSMKEFLIQMENFQSHEEVLRPY